MQAAEYLQDALHSSRKKIYIYICMYVCIFSPNLRGYWKGNIHIGTKFVSTYQVLIHVWNDFPKS